MILLTLLLFDVIMHNMQDRQMIIQMFYKNLFEYCKAKLQILKITP